MLLISYTCERVVNINFDTHALLKHTPTPLRYTREQVEFETNSLTRHQFEAEMYCYSSRAVMLLVITYYYKF